MGQKSATELRLLVVDDDEAIRNVLGMIYGGSYRLDAAATLREAAIKLLQERYDVVVLDVQLPDGNGTELLRAIRQNPRFSSCRDVPVVMLTASQDGKIYETSWDLGSVAYVTKPFDVPDLSAAIEQATGQAPAPA